MIKTEMVATTTLRMKKNLWKALLLTLGVILWASFIPHDRHENQAIAQESPLVGGGSSQDQNHQKKKETTIASPSSLHERYPKNLGKIGAIMIAGVFSLYLFIGKPASKQQEHVKEKAKKTPSPKTTALSPPVDLPRTTGKRGRSPLSSDRPVGRLPLTEATDDREKTVRAFNKQAKEHWQNLEALSKGDAEDATEEALAKLKTSTSALTGTAEMLMITWRRGKRKYAPPNFFSSDQGINTEILDAILRCTKSYKGKEKLSRALVSLASTKFSLKMNHFFALLKENPQQGEIAGTAEMLEITRKTIERVTPFDRTYRASLPLEREKIRKAIPLVRKRKRKEEIPLKRALQKLMTLLMSEEKLYFCTYHRNVSTLDWHLKRTLHLLRAPEKKEIPSLLGKITTVAEQVLKTFEKCEHSIGRLKTEKINIKTIGELLYTLGCDKEHENLRKILGDLVYIKFNLQIEKFNAYLEKGGDPSGKEAVALQTVAQEMKYFLDQTGGAISPISGESVGRTFELTCEKEFETREALWEVLEQLQATSPHYRQRCDLELSASAGYARFGRPLSPSSLASVEEEKRDSIADASADRPAFSSQEDPEDLFSSVSERELELVRTSPLRAVTYDSSESLEIDASLSAIEADSSEKRTPPDFAKASSVPLAALEEGQEGEEKKEKKQRRFFSKFSGLLKRKGKKKAKL